MLSKEKLKEKLLATGCFEANEHLDNYVLLCSNNQGTKRTKFKTNAHHIIPRKYYKVNKLPLDNSEENLVNLSKYDHILAHYYLVLCSIPIYLQHSNAVAFVMLTNSKFITVDEIKQIQNLDGYLEVYKNYVGRPRTKEHCAALSKARDFHSSTKGRKSIYNPKLNQVKFVYLQEIQEYLDKGWVLGGKPMSKEAKQKISASNSISLRGKVHNKDKQENKIYSGLLGSKIECVETVQIFDNISQAKLWLYATTGVDGGQIKNCCSGARKTTGGYHWRYYKESGDIIE